MAPPIVDNSCRGTESGPPWQSHTPQILAQLCLDGEKVYRKNSEKRLLNQPSSGRIDRQKQLFRFPLPPAETLFVTVERESFDILSVGFGTIAPRIEAAELLLAFELAPTPEEHGPVRIVPSLQRRTPGLIENLK
jgi:hypothetical protein